MDNNTDSFNHDFYTSLYDDAKDFKNAVDSFNHWRKIGKDNGRVCNEEQYYRLLADMTSFEYEIYVNSNISLKSFNSLSKDMEYKNKQENLHSASEYFFKSHVHNKNGKKLQVPYLHIINSLELNEYMNKWDNIYVKLLKYTNFDYKFYWDMYSDIEATQSMDIFKHWITTGMFDNRRHNDKDRIDNLRVYISGISKEIDFDWIFFKNKYRTVLTQYDKKQCNFGKSLDCEINAFLYFINYARELKLCLNEKEYNDHIEKYVELHKKNDEIIKNVDNKKMLPIIEDKYNTMLKKQPKSKYDAKNYTLSKYENKYYFSPSYINKILSDDYIALMKTSYKNEETTTLESTIKLLAKKEYAKFCKKDDNVLSQDTIVFLTSIVYNGLLRLKTESMEKNEYVEIVKKNMIEIFKGIKSNINKDEIVALGHDIDFAITHKKIVKLSRILAKVAVMTLI